MKLMLCAAAFLGLFAVPVDAASLYPSETRAGYQQTRIGNGISQGQITGREAAVLQHGQNRVARAQGLAARDGVVTGREAHRINHMQNVQSRHIFRARHNGRRV